MRRAAAVLLCAALALLDPAQRVIAASSTAQAPARRVSAQSFNAAGFAHPSPGFDLRPSLLLEPQATEESAAEPMSPAVETVSQKTPAQTLPTPGDERQEAIELVRHPERVALPPARVESLSEAEGSTAARQQFDRIVGGRSVEFGSDISVPAERTGLLRPLSGWRLAAPSRGPPSADSSRGWLQILPDRKSDRELKKYFGIMALFMAGFNSLYAALPGLFSGAGSLGMVRAVSYGGQAAGNFTTGPMLHRFAPKKLLSMTWFGRSPAMFFIAALAIAVPYGYLSAQSFFFCSIGLFAAEGLLQSWSMTAGNVVYNGIVGMDEAHFNRATAVYDILSNAVGAAASLGASFLIKTVNSAIGIPHFGEAVAVGLFAAVLVACGVWSLFLKMPDGHAAEAEKKSLSSQLKEGWSTIVKDRFLWVTMLFCTIEFMTASAFFYPMLSRYMNDVVQAAGSGFFSKDGLFGLYLSASYIGPLIAGIAMIYWRDRPMTRFENALSRIKEGLEGNGQSAQASASMIVSVRTAVGGALDQFRKAAGGQENAAWSAQKMREEIVSRIPETLRPALRDAGFDVELDAWLGEQLNGLLKEARKEAKSGRDFLERQWYWTTILFGLGSLCYIGVFWSPLAAGSLGFMLLSALLQAPASVVGQSLTQRILQRRYEDKMGQIYAAQFLYANLLIIAGLFLFVYLMKVLSIKWLLLTVAGVQAASAVLRFAMARFALPKHS